MQALAAREPRKNVVDDRAIDMELGDVPADILVLGVPEELELRLIGAQDDAVGTDRVQAHRSSLEEVIQRLLAAPQALVGLATLDEVGSLARIQVEPAQLLLVRAEVPYAQCVDIMPSGRPSRAMSGVDCTPR